MRKLKLILGSLAGAKINNQKALASTLQNDGILTNLFSKNFLAKILEWTL